MPEMLKGGVIVDADQAKIAEDADAVMAPERVPADIRVQSYAGIGVEATCASSGVARKHGRGRSAIGGGSCRTSGRSVEVDDCVGRRRRPVARPRPSTYAS